MKKIAPNSDQAYRMIKSKKSYDMVKTTSGKRVKISIADMSIPNLLVMLDRFINKDGLVAWRRIYEGCKKKGWLSKEDIPNALQIYCSMPYDKLKEIDVKNGKIKGK